MDNLIGEIITKHWDIPIFLRASLVFNFLTWGPFEEGYIKRVNRQWYSKIQNLKICNIVYIIKNNKWLEYQPYFDNRSTSFKFYYIIAYWIVLCSPPQMAPMWESWKLKRLSEIWEYPSVLLWFPQSNYPQFVDSE